MAPPSKFYKKGAESWEDFYKKLPPDSAKIFSNLKLLQKTTFKTVSYTIPPNVWLLASNGGMVYLFAFARGSLTTPTRKQVSLRTDWYHMPPG